MLPFKEHSVTRSVAGFFETNSNPLDRQWIPLFFDRLSNFETKELFVVNIKRFWQINYLNFCDRFSGFSRNERRIWDLNLNNVIKKNVFACKWNDYAIPEAIEILFLFQKAVLKWSRIQHKKIWKLGRAPLNFQLYLLKHP